jgi:hypothetical protein
LAPYGPSSIRSNALSEMESPDTWKWEINLDQLQLDQLGPSIFWKSVKTAGYRKRLHHQEME